MPPSVTIPAAPRTWARKPRMSPIVPFRLRGHRHGARGIQPVVRRDDGTAQPPGGRVTGGDLYLDHVARLDDGGAGGGPGGGPGEDHIAGLERHQPRHVSDDLVKAEKQLVAHARVLGELAVDPGAQPQPGRVYGPRVKQPGAERSEAVDSLGPDVGSAVGMAEVVHAEVVGRGDPGHMLPGTPALDAAAPAAEDKGNLAFEGEQLAPGRAAPRDSSSAVRRPRRGCPSGRSR